MSRLYRQRYETLLEQLGVGVFIFCLSDKKIVEASSFFCSQIGIAQESVHETSLLQLWVLEECKIDELVKSCIKFPHPKPTNQIFKRKNGSYRLLQCSFAQIDLGYKKLIQATAKDVTDLIVIENELAKNENRYKKILSTTTEGFWMVNARFRTVEVNLALCEMLGFTKFDMLQKHPLDFAHKQDRLKLFSLLTPTQEETKRTDELRLLKNDGETITVRVHASTLVSDGNEEGFAFAFVTDISELKLANERIVDLGEKQHYQNRQQEDAFKKQVRIIRDEMSGLKVGETLFDSYFEPLDTLSGDTYGTVDLKNGEYLFYIIDAMGKGLSACVTAIQSSSFINNTLDTMILSRCFELSTLADLFVGFIKKQLLDDEIICALLFVFDDKNGVIQVANFGMPPVFIHQTNDRLLILKTNNLPITPYSKTAKINQLEVEGIDKILCCSDGVTEADLGNGKSYRDYIENDFLLSNTKLDFIKKMKSRIGRFEDDITVIFLRRFFAAPLWSIKHVTLSTISQVEEALDKIERSLLERKIAPDSVHIINASARELAFNALEHGSYGICSKEKNEALEDDRFDELLQKKSEEKKYANKKIKIELAQFSLSKSEIFALSVADEGCGFDTVEFMKSLKLGVSDKFGGRGIRICRKNTDGLYYNKKGNKVTLLQIIPKETKNAHQNNLK